jgi:Transposase DDE domain
MSHRDVKAGVGRLDSTCLKLSLRWLLQDVDWSDIGFRTDCTWTPFLLTATALMWAWSSELTLVERFEAACRIAVHLFFPKSRLATSYQAFTKLLRRWTEPLIELLKKRLRERMQRELNDCWLILGFVVFASDGSRGELPRTRSHEQAYSHRRKRKSRKGRKPRNRRLRKSDAKKANSPQLWMTTMWHVGSGLPWDWRLGPADSSERAHLRAMLSTLPAGALIAVDAGFVGYEYLRAIADSGRHVLLRVGANVRLLKGLGYVRERGNTVYLWPDSEARKGQPPLVLRMVVAHNGRHPLYLVTNVLSESRLTDKQIIELYARRWGIELFYRHLKQTFQRRKMRSTSAGNALQEMHWSYAGLWAMALYTSIEFRRHGLPVRRLSVARMLRAFRHTMRDYLHPTKREKTLRERLRMALIDNYQRKNKASRDYPRKKQEKPPGPPRIVPASAAQIQTAQELHCDLVAKGLTA